MTGRMLDERLGKMHFWMLFIGFHTHVPGPALAGRRGHAAPLRRLPAHRRLHHAEHDLHDRRVPARRLDAAVPLQRLQVVEVRPAGRCATTRGATAARWSGRRPARRRGTTSSRSRGSAPSGRRSTCTTRTWSSGCRPRRTPASGTSPTPHELVDAAPARGRARTTPTRPSEGPSSPPLARSGRCPGGRSKGRRAALRAAGRPRPGRRTPRPRRRRRRRRRAPRGRRARQPAG